MNRFKENIFAKVGMFILLQLCTLSMVFSGIIVGINANNGWYSKDSTAVREYIFENISEYLSSRVSGEVYQGTYVPGEDLTLKDQKIPDGIGYEVEIVGGHEEDVDSSGIDLSKNADLLKKAGAYSETIDHNAIVVTTYVMDPEKTETSIDDLFPESVIRQYNIYMYLYKWHNTATVFLIISMLLGVLLATCLLAAVGCGRKEGSLLNKVPIDALAGITIISIIVVILVAMDVLYMYGMWDIFMYSDLQLRLLIVVCIVLIISTLFTGYICFAVSNMKQKGWWKCTVIYYICCIVKKISLWLIYKFRRIIKVIRYGVGKLPVVWKAVVVTTTMLLVNLIIICNFYWSDAAQFLWFVMALIVIAGVGYVSLCMRRLAKGAEHLAKGDLNYKVNDKGMYGDFAAHASNLNNVSDGMAAAVEERLRSERFRTELITNVSHDIKTPLTSIINYVDLLKNDGIDSEAAEEYLEVIERQSNRLKKLTEDIVEASKASTGNVEINLAPCQVGVLMEQTIGEYKEKAEAAGLQFVVKVPDEDVEIMADGRRMWRVFDNLLNNVCKYTQTGTRVYMNLNCEGKRAVITFRNISKYELDITERELMERFVRGDRSRHTEGSGLGLSIARNLIELQGGCFDIFIDGDLFKVIISFDIL